MLYRWREDITNSVKLEIKYSIVDQFVFFSLIIDDKLNWKCHIVSINSIV